jgi:DNA-binding transcriptional regulator YbjK
MARNDQRRTDLADAAVRVLAHEGARGLTHRAIDAEAGFPRGTSSNYFPTRDAIIEAIIARIGARLAPDPAVHGTLAERAPGRELFAAYMRDILTRLLSDRDAALSLFELRLEAARRTEVAEVIGGWLRAGFDADVAFNERMRLPGGRSEIALFHYAMDGLILDRLTTPIDPDTAADSVADELVSRLLPGA